MIDYIPAAFGLLGTLIGGTIAATVSLIVARQARMAAEQDWVRDSRRGIYDRFLTTAQNLLMACLSYRKSNMQGEPTDLKNAYSAFFEAYTVVQTVAELSVVNAARVQAYRLLELNEHAMGGTGVLGDQAFDQVAWLVRDARHDTIDAMRIDLGLKQSAKPPEPFNPFQDTGLEEPYRRGTELEQEHRRAKL